MNHWGKGSDMPWEPRSWRTSLQEPVMDAAVRTTNGPISKASLAVVPEPQTAVATSGHQSGDTSIPKTAYRSSLLRLLSYGQTLKRLCLSDHHVSFHTIIGRALPNHHIRHRMGYPLASRFRNNASQAEGDWKGLRSCIMVSPNTI